jgi:hypothetical protein
MDNDIKQAIRRSHKYALSHSKALETLLHALDNEMNECSCGDRKAFDFRNVSTETDCFILCVNCGGYIEPKDNEQTYF